MKMSPELLEIAKFIGHKDLRSLLFLQSLVWEMQPELVVELGTGYACSTIFIAMGLGTGHVISIDNHMDQAEDIDIPLANVEKCGMTDRVVLKTGSTFDSGTIVRREFPDVKAGVLFMDASHNKKDLWREYQAVQPILADRHIIMIDDLISEDTSEFYRELAEGYSFCAEFPYHNGSGVIGTDDDFNDIVDEAANSAS